MIIIKSEIINSFSKSVEENLSQVAGLCISKNKTFIKKSIKEDSCVNIVCGITGSIYGQVILCIPKEIATVISSTMLNDIPIVIIDDKAKDVLLELGSIIFANSIAYYKSLGMDIDMTLPVIIIGDNIEYFTKSKVDCVSFDCEIGKIMLYFILKQTKVER